MHVRLLPYKWPQDLPVCVRVSSFIRQIQNLNIFLDCQEIRSSKITSPEELPGIALAHWMSGPSICMCLSYPMANGQPYPEANANYKGSRKQGPTRQREVFISFLSKHRLASEKPQHTNKCLKLGLLCLTFKFTVFRLQLSLFPLVSAQQAVDTSRSDSLSIRFDLLKAESDLPGAQDVFSIKVGKDSSEHSLAS